MMAYNNLQQTADQIFNQKAKSPNIHSKKNSTSSQPKMAKLDKSDLTHLGNRQGISVSIIMDNAKKDIKTVGGGNHASIGISDNSLSSSKQYLKSIKQLEKHQA